MDEQKTCIVCGKETDYPPQCVYCKIQSSKYEEELTKKERYRNSWKKSEKLFTKKLIEAGNEFFDKKKKIYLCNQLIGIVNLNKNFHDVTPRIFNEVFKLIETINE